MNDKRIYKFSSIALGVGLVICIGLVCEVGEGAGKQTNYPVESTVGDDVFLLAGVRTSLLPEKDAAKLSVKVDVKRPELLTDREWKLILGLVARVPGIKGDREIVDVIGWLDVGPLLMIRVQISKYFIYFTRDPTKGWKVNTVTILS